MTDAPTTPGFDPPRRLAAEAIGTAVLLARIVGSGIMAATGAILAVLILVFGPISGAHFNPAVTVSFLVPRALRQDEAAGFFVRH